MRNKLTSSVPRDDFQSTYVINSLVNVDDHKVNKLIAFYIIVSYA